MLFELKSAKQPDFDMAYHMIVRQIADEFVRHRFVMEGVMPKGHRERYMDIMTEKADRNAMNDSLKFLSECLERYYGKKVIILTDEYDVPLENAFLEGFYDEMAGFIRSLFESVFKTNSSLEFAVITGCLRISRESIFTGMNNLEIFSILNRNYSGYFGFTEEEVRSERFMILWIICGILCFLPGIFEKCLRGWMFRMACISGLPCLIKRWCIFFGQKCLPGSKRR